MSAKVFPYEVAKKRGMELPLFIDVASRHLEKMTVVNMDDRTVNEIWVPIINQGASTRSIIEGGRKVLEHVTEKDKFGKPKTVTKVVGHVYGYEALAMSLSDFGVPITAEEVQKQVEEKIAAGSKHTIFCLKSDLVPVMPEKYAEMGEKNSWVLVSSLPSGSEYKKRINSALAKSGSRFRIPQYLDIRLVDRV
jgi:hypothetical protein